MNDNFDYENLKSIKFPINYNKDVSNYNNINSNNSYALKEKLALLENNIKSSNPYKKIQDTNLNLDYNNNSSSNFKKTGKTGNNLNGNEGINNTIKLMDIKLNHEILQSKIENMRKDLIEENRHNNNTNSNTNFLDLKPFEFKIKTEYENRINNYKTEKLYSNKDNSNDRFHFNNNQINKENDLKISNLKNFSEYDDNRNRNNFTTTNFFSKDNKFKYDNLLNYSEFADKLRKTTLNKFNYQLKAEKENNLNKTMGNFEYEKNIISPGLKINNNDLKLDYTKKDLADLEVKIKSTKEKLNDCLHKAETIIIDRKINEKIKSRKNNENDNYLLYSKSKTIDDIRNEHYRGKIFILSIIVL